MCGLLKADNSKHGMTYMCTSVNQERDLDVGPPVLLVAPLCIDIYKH